MAQDIGPNWTIEVVRGTRPTLALRILDRDGNPKDLTGPMVLFLAVKRALTDPDSAIWFDLQLTVTSAVDGLVDLPVTDLESGNPAGSWPGELRMWNAGDPADSAPRDAYAGTFVLPERVVEVET